MDKNEIKEELAMSYQSLCDYLLQKYGCAKGNYFHTENCKSKRKDISRTSDGLICHHIREDRGGNLSETTSASLQPFEWQKKENLVFCNLIEHLILHVKIAVMRNKTYMNKPSDIDSFFTTGGIFMICKDIIELFANNGSSIKWRQRCFDEISNNYSDFLDILVALFSYISSHYDGDKSQPKFLTIGSIIHFKDVDGKIIKLLEDLQFVIVKVADGRMLKVPSDILINMLTYCDKIAMLKRYVCFSFQDGFNREIFMDFIQHDNSVGLKYSKILEIDYKGYGFPAFSKDYVVTREIKKSSLLSGTPEKHTVDEYLYWGLPSTFGISTDEHPVSLPTFWKGDIPNNIKNNSSVNYVLRANAIFSIKNGEIPFLKYKIQTSIMHRSGHFDNENNLLYKNGVILSNSYDHPLIAPNQPLIISISKADIPYFFERYKVDSFDIIDGCYWNIKA